MKYVAIILLAVSLAGCWQTTNPNPNIHNENWDHYLDKPKDQNSGG